MLSSWRDGRVTTGDFAIIIAEGKGAQQTLCWLLKFFPKVTLITSAYFLSYSSLLFPVQGGTTAYLPPAPWSSPVCALSMPLPALLVLHPDVTLPRILRCDMTAGGHSQETLLPILPKGCTWCVYTHLGTPFLATAPTLDQAAFLQSSWSPHPPILTVLHALPLIDEV